MDNVHQYILVNAKTTSRIHLSVSEETRKETSPLHLICRDTDPCFKYQRSLSISISNDSWSITVHANKDQPTSANIPSANSLSHPSMIASVHWTSIKGQTRTFEGVLLPSITCSPAITSCSSRNAIEIGDKTFSRQRFFSGSLEPIPDWDYVLETRMCDLFQRFSSRRWA